MPTPEIVTTIVGQGGSVLLTGYLAYEIHYGRFDDFVSDFHRLARIVLAISEEDENIDDEKVREELPAQPVVSDDFVASPGDGPTEELKRDGD
jgi:hypothetical protein